MIFQEPLTRLNPLMRISEHFEETLHTHAPWMSRDETGTDPSNPAPDGHSADAVRSYPHEFSGGMRQRIMIALVLVLRPAFVVADEPTTALDVLVEAQIRHPRRPPPNFGTALLLITHNLGIVAKPVTGWP